MSSSSTLAVDLDQLAATGKALGEAQTEARTLLANTLQTATAASTSIRGTASPAWAALLQDWQTQATAHKTQGEQLADGTTTAAKAYTATDTGNANDVKQDELLTGGQSSVNPNASATSSATATASAVTAASLYGSNGSPSPDDVHQNGIGDCYFDSAMAAAANADPSFIKNHIVANSDGTFAVTLYDWPYDRGWKADGSNPNSAPVQKTITVTQADITTDQKALGVNSGVSGAPNWPVVMESAYAKMEYGSVTSTSVNSIGSGAVLDQGMAAVTGKTGSLYIAPYGGSIAGEPANWHSGVPSESQIVTALANHQAVTLGTPGGGSAEFKDGIVQGHAYTVTSASTAANGDTMVTMRNPWGTNEGVTGNNTSNAYVTIDLTKEINNQAVLDLDLGPSI